MNQTTKPTHPQRLSRATLPGALLKRMQGLATRLRLHEASERDPVYLNLIRQCPCLRCGMDPAGIAAHVRMQSGAYNKHGGMGIKPHDKFTVPLCQACHTDDLDSQHRIGELAFWHLVGINPLLVAQRLYAQRGDLVAMRAVALVAIAGRGA